MSILCIGRATFDLGYACPSFPAEDGKLSATHFWAGAGGSALNGAVTARALGSEVRLFTLLGAGSFADSVRAELARYHVPVEDFAAPDAEVLPVSSIIVVPERGTRTIIDQQPAQSVAPEAPPASCLDGVDVVYCDGFLPEIAVPLAKAARERGTPVVLDGGSWKPFTGELIAHVDHAIVSERFHPPGQGEADILDAVHALGPSVAAITRGPGLVEWSDGAHRGTLSPPRVQAIDTLGAGDIFHGAYCHYLAGGEQVEASLSAAARIAAESCRFYGTRAWIDARR
ncbi:PfkB family carbohydrate kinase [Aurantiacibacter poecillastricola]|uniref:PfkB family carbohydrate kinase n=1 Tax=Aurantiacibacter poecillastricola TaxID=3064385 RepID=UPI00273E693E|nr:PfkB family carbohydrate kinase [Aurantiacibacter sp. 219JJ12-13]MDP5260891.1 PfkB family carbohydrate kinase [Aurantiacibacter sp. 219JJ12-13]